MQELKIENFFKSKKKVKRKLHSGKTVEITPWTMDDQLQFIQNLEDLKDISKQPDKADVDIQIVEAMFDHLQRFCSIDIRKDLNQKELFEFTILIRKLSSGSTIDYEYQCPNCKTKNEFVISLKNDVIIETKEQPLLKIEEYSILMKDVSVKELNDLEKEFSGQTQSKKLNFGYQRFYHSIDKIMIDDNEIVFKTEQIPEFFSQFKTSKLEELLIKFLESIPKIQINLEHKCSKKDCNFVFKDKIIDAISLLVF